MSEVLDNSGGYSKEEMLAAVHAMAGYALGEDDKDTQKVGEAIDGVVRDNMDLVRGGVSDVLDKDDKDLAKHTPELTRDEVSAVLGKSTKK